MTCRSVEVGIKGVFVALITTAVWPGMPVQAAEITDVVDAFDEEADDLFDFHLEPSFSQRIERGTIVREANCTPDPNGPPDAFANAEQCLDEADIIFNKELDYERVISQLDILLQVGLWRDLEFHINFPIIFSDSRDISFAAGDGGRGVDQDNSTLDPADRFVEADLADGSTYSTYRFFGVDEVGNGPTRKGLGDISFGLAWSPYNDEREPHLATITLGFDYVAPTAETATRTNTGVGRGVHELQFSVAASRRFSIIEPYLGVRYVLPLRSSDSLFEAFGGGQKTEAPGQRAETTAGTEFIAYENTELDQRLSIDVGFDFAFQAEGRDYSPLFDAFGSSECNGTTPAEADFELGGAPYEPDAATNPDAAACAWILQQPSAERTNPGIAAPNRQYFHDGITTIESYAIIGAHLGFAFQISRYIELRVNTRFETETEHFLTSARTGTDRDGDDEVDFNNPNERNPVYNPTLDGVGRRLRAESVFNFGWNAALAFQF